MRDDSLEKEPSRLYDVIDDVSLRELLADMERRDGNETR